MVLNELENIKAASFVEPMRLAVLIFSNSLKTIYR